MLELPSQLENLFPDFKIDPRAYMSGFHFTIRGTN
jgi:hypothetical protein